MNASFEKAFQPLGQPAGVYPYVLIQVIPGNVASYEEIERDMAKSAKGGMQRAEGALKDIVKNTALNSVTFDRYQPNRAFPPIWKSMFHLYHYNAERFMQSYHKRSNVETAFHMIKSKFGIALRSKTKTAQINEALCKVLCHNICCLIQSIFELGIEPTFWSEAI